MEDDDYSYLDDDHEIELERPGLFTIEELDKNLTDEQLLMLIDVGFDGTDEVGPTDETWYPNIRSQQILVSIDPNGAATEGALKRLTELIRELSGGDWAKACRLLRSHGMAIPVEDAVLSERNSQPDSTTRTTSLFEEMKRRRESLILRERDLAPTAEERKGMTSNRPAKAFEPRDVVSILGEMAQMEGMTTVSAWAHSLVAQCHTESLRRKAGLDGNLEMPRHLVLRGDPGTGKTVGARLLTELYAALGIVRLPKFIEASRADLVAGYIGQTALKTRGIVTQALGGVLFIDESYSLNMGNGDFANEAVAELIQLMETHRNDFAVFFAGYPAEMEEFIRMNTGLASRVSATLDFNPYTNDELWKVLNRMALVQSFMIDPKARDAVNAWLDHARKSDDFGNARSARHLVNLMKANQAARVYESGLTDVDDLILLTAADVPTTSPMNESDRR